MFCNNPFNCNITRCLQQIPINKLIKWTPSNHHSFSKNTKLCILNLMILQKNKIIKCSAIDIFFLILQFSYSEFFDNKKYCDEDAEILSRNIIISNFKN